MNVHQRLYLSGEPGQIQPSGVGDDGGWALVIRLGAQ